MMNEQIIIALTSILIGLFTAWDLFVDAGTGVSVNHIALEASVVLCSSFIFIRMIFLVFSRNREAIKLKADNQKYREQTQSLLAGVGIIIEKQMVEWGLTQSEKEVAMFLLKGLSHKEIAEMRNSNEKTIRQQSSQVYSKANLKGRAELSAFFLEDLLLPQNK